ncbi:MAG: Smr/MutS family protein [Chloroflexi bacterium]|nr:Smr/MutS family protein [Chloroflexota bacterium]
MLEHEAHNDDESPDLTPRQTLAERSRELIEWPKLLDLLAGRAQMFRARELALKLEPSSDEREIERLQEETAEARRIIDESGDIGLGGLIDPRPYIERAELGGVLEGEALLRTGQVLRSLSEARDAAQALGRATPVVGILAALIPDLRWLDERIGEAIDERGNIRDSATPDLGRLRSGVGERYRRLTSHLERLIARPKIRGAIQAPVVSTRGDRLVIEVRADQRSAVPGIVHDVSNTGQTLFVEPFDAVDLCNGWREASAAVVREEDKVLRRLSKLVADRARDAMMAIEAAGRLDLVFTRARLAHAMRAARAITLPASNETALNLVDVRHPLLGEQAVPISLSVGAGFRALVITGPNTGGKTVALKTAGLAVLMHQSGMQVPGDPLTEISVFDGVYVDIGDAQSIERSVSTFSSHLGAVVDVLAEANDRSLVLLDELGTGTDPEEGSALARAILDHLVQLGVPTIVTTHHRAVAEHAGETPGMRNAAVELNPDTMLPSYRVSMGTPGRSYAMSVAERLGLPEAVLDRARSFLSPEHSATETLLLQLQRERSEIEGRLASAESDRIKAEAARSDLERRVRAITEAQDDLVEETRRELQVEAEEVRTSLRQIQRRAGQERDMAAVRRETDRVRRSLQRADRFNVTRPAESKQIEPEEAPPAPRPLTAGDIVEVRGLNARATVVDVNPDGSVNLHLGNARVTLNVARLKVVTPSEDAPAQEAPRITTSIPIIDEPTRELDIRGIRAIEVYERVVAFLDEAALLGLTSVRVIHGKGTGALRDATREALQRHPAVGGFERSEQSMGGDGSTEVELL